MAKEKKRLTERPAIRGERVKLTRDESLKRLEEFSKRRKRFIAAVRKGKGR